MKPERFPFCRSAALVCCVMSFLWMSTARAEFIQPVDCWVSNGEGIKDTLINGQAFDDSVVGSPDSIHSAVGAEMWTGVGSVRESAVFDLGQSVSLTKVYIWNYNVTDATDIGMKDVEVQVSPDTNMTNANFNAIARITLQEGGEKAQVFDVVGTSVRLVKLKGLSNWGHGWSVGLAEARFESGQITGNVPYIVVNSPHEGDEIAFGTDVVFDTKITDKDADMQKAEFFDGDTLVATKTAAPYSVTLTQPAKGDHALRVLATDKSGKSAWFTVNITVRQLVADRIIKIDDTADEGAELNQIRYVGAWNLAQGNENDPRYNHNDHYDYSNNKNDYFEVRFLGVKIDLFATVASHHGTGMASIDGGPESKVNYKATQRKEQVFVWGSPILANREHVLKVRIGGDGVVTADRFDVSVSDKPDQAQITLKTFTFTEVVVEMEDIGASVVDTATVKLYLDGALVPATVVKAGTITTVTHTVGTAFLPGSSHLLKVEALDKAGASLSRELPFALPAPPFPLTGLGGPASTAGNWGFRQIWNAGRVDAVVSAVDTALRANQAGFIGKIQDTQQPYIDFALSSNPGGGGLFTENLPMPAEPEGLSASDFVTVARAKVAIPRSGDWTIGVHSDEGFALRFKGALFDSVSGNGVRDDNFPEYIGFLTDTADSNTRGVLKGIAAGEYEIEFITYQRVGGSHCEVYAVEGEFVEDTDTDQWQLIGGPGGLEILEGPTLPLTIRGIAKAGARVTIDFDSPEPDGAHQLLESTDLKSWQRVVAAVFEKTGGSGVRATVSSAIGNTKFYRISLP